MHASNKATEGGVLIVGAGPGIGLAVARRFSRGGQPVGLVARSAERLTQLSDTLQAEGIRTEWQAADATAAEDLARGIRLLIQKLGPIEVLCFSPLPSLALIRPILETAPREFIESFSLNVAGAAAAVAEVTPGMIERGHGTLLFTTGSAALNPTPERAASVVTTAAETAYVDLLHRALTPRGIRVAQLAIVGAVGPGAAHEPDDVAEALWVASVSADGPLTVLRQSAVEGAGS